MEHVAIKNVEQAEIKVSSCRGEKGEGKNTVGSSELPPLYVWRSTVTMTGIGFYRKLI